MPTWGEILRELQVVATQLQAGQAPPGYTPGASAFDHVRRKYLKALAERTGRATLLYASRWTQGGVEPELVSITAEDVQGLMETLHGLSGIGLDIVLHSPGGSAEATEAIVKYLRSKFDDIRIFVPHAAMSAATMLACSANRIVMGKHSFLGPIDPQFIIQTQIGRASVAAHAIEEQFAMAKEECKKDPGVLPAWLAILQQYGPALIVQCKLARELSESLVATWLDAYMFGNAAHKSGAEIAKKLADHATFKSHNRFIGRDQAKGLGLIIEDLEADQGLQDAVLSVFHAASHTLSGTPAVKLIENNLGKAFLKIAQVQQVVMAPTQPQPMPIPSPSQGLPPAAIG